MKKQYFFFFLMLSNTLIAQIKKNYQILNLKADIIISPEKKFIKGDLEYKIRILKKTDSILLDSKGLNITNVKSRFFPTTFNFTDKYLIIKRKFKENKTYKLKIKYEAFPKQAMYFVGWEGNGRKQVWTQGQGKQNSHWLPTDDNQTNKFTWNLNISVPKNYQVVSNGKKTKILDGSNNFSTYSFKMEKPAPAYLIFIGIGQFVKDTVYSSSGIPIYNYMYPDKKAQDKTYYKSKDILDFLEKEIGIAYPWDNYKQFPARDFLYGGMENVSATVFNGNRYVVDSIEFHDTNYVNVQAHELTHQWFGDWVTGKTGKDHWLHEGFATYYARLTDSLIFGNDFYQNEIYQYDWQIIRASQTDTIPIHSTHASSLSYYQKGARVVQMLRNTLGNEKFKKIIKSFLYHYQLKNASIEDLQNEIYLQTGDSLKNFFSYWLDTSKIPYFKIKQEKNQVVFLENEDHKKLEFLLIYPYQKQHIYTDKTFSIPNPDSLQALIVNPNNKLLAKIDLEQPTYFVENQIFYSPFFIDRLKALKKIVNNPNRTKIYKKLLQNKENNFIYTEVARQIIQNPPQDSIFFLKKLMQKDLKTRQYIAIHLQKIPLSLQSQYIGILSDSSYISKQAVLWHYIMNFPTQAPMLLNKTRNIYGSNDRSFRMTWLSLALLVKGYNPSLKPQYYQELTHYTSVDYPLNIRLNAFYTLDQLNLFSPESINNLLDASLYFNWHLHAPVRKILKKLYKNKAYQKIIDQLVSNKDKKIKEFFYKFLN